MAKGKHTHSVTTSMPKTGWQEPPRVGDELLKLPKGRSRTPTNEVHDSMLAEIASDSRMVGSETVVPAADRISTARQLIGCAPSEVDREAKIGQLDGAMEQPEEYDGDAEDGHESVEQTTDSSSIVADENLKFALEALEELGNDHLLAGEEGEVENEGLSTPAASSPHPIPASRHRAKALNDGTESISPHPTDATKVIITYRCTNPSGGMYFQDTEIPKVISDPSEASNESGGVIFPDVETSKVPRTKKGSPWTPVPGTSKYEWARGNGEHRENWRINVFFRRLDRDTHAFQDIYVNTNILKNVNPNDKRFRTSYNKWILQFARRRDAAYTQKVVRVHWSIAERCALYTSINAFCARYGVDRFGFTANCKLDTAQLQRMADAVNAVPNPLRLAPRGVDAVRGQIVSAHDKAQPKNKAIYDLMVNAPALRARLASGEVLPRALRKPMFAIPLSAFPVDSPVAAPRPSPSAGRKRKRDAVEVRDSAPSSSELSSPPASEIDETGGSFSADTWMTTDEEMQLGESEEANWSDTSEELLPGEQWTEVDEVMSSSPPAKKARDT